MRVSEILNFALPYTKEDRQCGMKKAAKIKARAKLAEMIEAYKRGDIITWEGLSFSVDVEEIVKRMQN